MCQLRPLQKKGDQKFQLVPYILYLIFYGSFKTTHMGKFIKSKLLTIVFIGVWVTSFSQEIGEVYSSQVKPGTDKWKQFQTHQEMVLGSQIPNEKLSSLSTSALINACLEYPLAFDVFAFDNLKNGFLTCFGKFNGYQELLSRPNAGKEVLNKFINVNPNNIDLLKSDIDKGNFTLSLTVLEMLLSQREILNQLNGDERTLILKYAIENKRSKIKHKDHFSTLGLFSLAYLVGNTLSENSIELTKYEKIFIEKMMLKDENIMNQIFEKATILTTKKN